MRMSLENWLSEGRLKRHKPSRNEIIQLLAVYERDMADAQSKTISTDRRFATAYNAALTVSAAALAVGGYRAIGRRPTLLGYSIPGLYLKTGCRNH